MILFKQIELLERIHKRIQTSHTGTPENFAQRMGVSLRRLYEIIEEMKGMGAPIHYSRSAETYYYEDSFEVHISCIFRRLSKEEQQDISAGNQFCLPFFFPACFPQ
jgi:predicted DNA-binding transcriptional regulator YafY